MSKLKKIAESVLKDHPAQNQVFITEDGQAFFSELSANQHNKRSAFESNPEPFYREGFEPEDTKELEEDLKATKAEKDKLVALVTEVFDATDLTKDAPEVNQETPEVVAKVVSLREAITEKEASYKEVLEVVTRACDLTNDFPEVKVSDEALPVIQQVLGLREELGKAHAELQTLKAAPLDVKDTEEVKEPNTKK